LNTPNTFPPSPIAFGDWIYDPSNLTLRYREKTPDAYEIDLEICTTSAEVLDWIFQVRSKMHVGPIEISDLLRALKAIIDPQATLCSWGKERGPILVNREGIAKRLRQFAEVHRG